MSGRPKKDFDKDTLYGMWKYISDTGYRGKTPVSNWLCTSCKQEFIRANGNIIQGRSKSCNECRKIGSDKKTFNLIRSSSKRRKKDFSLSFEQWKKISSKDCYYCGMPPSNIIDTYGDYRYNGLDRIDNTAGYSIDNVVPCCKMCNYIRNSATQEEFLEWIDRIYERKQKNAIQK